LGKLLMFLGGTIFLVGLVLALLGRTGIPMGRLPGDLVYRSKNTTIYFPLATSIVVSLALSLLLWALGRLRQ
jgi:hypothetical protein